MSTELVKGSPDIFCRQTLVEAVVKTSGFRPLSLPQEFAQPDLWRKQKKGDLIRCVDDRSIESHRGVDSGPQVPGAAWGLVDAFTELTKTPRQQSLPTIKHVLDQLNIPFSAHTHCGYLGLVQEGKLEYQVVEPESTDSRLADTSTHGGVIMELVGQHGTNLSAIINTDPTETFNNVSANNRNLNSFNLDYGSIRIVGNTCAQLMKKLPENFGTLFANEVTRRYLKTVNTLAGIHQVYIR